MRKNNKSFRDFWGENPEWKALRIKMGFSDSLNVFFKYKGEDRRIFVSFDCDCDLQIYPEIEAESCLWFSMGCWGSSVELMTSLMQSFKDAGYGNCYVDKNDSDMVDFIKI